MNKNEVYLAGNYKIASAEGNDWRNYIIEQLKQYSDNLTVFNPNNHFGYEINCQHNEKLEMDFFLYRLNQSNFVVFNLNDSKNSIRTGIEFGMSLAADKFIVGFGKENISEYMKEKCSFVFNEVDEVVDFLLEHWN